MLPIPAACRSLIVVFFLLSSVGVPSGRAFPRHEVVHSWYGGPFNLASELVLAPDGNFYGASRVGGGYGNGCVFRMTPAGEISVVFEFTEQEARDDGAQPMGLTLGSDGNLYGLTEGGGRSINPAGIFFRLTTDGAFSKVRDEFNAVLPPVANDPFAGRLVEAADGNFYGTTRTRIFRLTPAGDLTLLHTHPTGASYTGALAGLILGPDGALYGTTADGGPQQLGNVFKITTEGEFTTLVNFTRAGSVNRGAGPAAELLLGADGNFYGTTLAGGFADLGTVFKMTPAGQLTTLHEFSGTQGRSPRSRLVMGGDGNYYGTADGFLFRIAPEDTFLNLSSAPKVGDHGLTLGPDGVLYGVTTTGGTQGGGTIFRTTVGGEVSTIVEFPRGSLLPESGLVVARDGNLYGTTDVAENGSLGGIYRVTPQGDHQEIAALGADVGSRPLGGLVLGSDGDLYGVGYGQRGGDLINEGTIFKVSTATGAVGRVQNFTGLSGSRVGRGPRAPLVQGLDGNFYGTTEAAGTRGNSGFGFGTVFRVSPTGVFKMLVGFTGDRGAKPGGGPTAPLTLGPDGNFYGTTYTGSVSGGDGFGEVFRMSPKGILKKLHQFNPRSEGSGPTGGVTFGLDGNLYGTTQRGGSARSFFDGGIVFRLTSAGVFTKLVDFVGPNGSRPLATLTRGPDGNFYGTTVRGGTEDFGTVFRVSSNGDFTKLLDFSGSGPGPNSGAFPGTGALVFAPDGNLYGTTRFGGPKGGGTVFRLVPLKCEAITGGVDGISASGATLRGMINPNGVPAKASFEWGTSADALNNSTATIDVGNGTDAVAVEAVLTGITKGTVYYYRLRGDNAEQFAPQRGEVLNFATISNNAPGIISQPASNLAATTATIRASVNPNSLGTSVYFQWGATTDYGNQTAPVNVGNGAGLVPVSADLAELSTDQSYHYRAVATSEAGVSMGPDRTFIPSAGAPQPQDDVVLIDGAASIRVLENDIDPNGDPLVVTMLDPDAMPEHGFAQIAGNLIAYSPDDNMLKDEFGYIVQDSTGKTARARVRAYRLGEIRGQYFGVLAGGGGNGSLNLEIMQTGAFSMLLTWLGQDYAVKGRLDSDRSSVAVFPRRGVEINAVLVLEIRFDPLTGQINAQLTDTVLGGPFGVDIPRSGDADAVVDAVAGTTYTTTIDAVENDPTLPDGAEAASAFASKFRGSGYAVVKIAKNRSARFVGQMPDTEKFSAGSSVARRTYAFYSALYRAKRGNLGSISGAATLQGDFQLRGNSLVWQREADTRDQIFSGQFNTPAILNGDRYTPPTRGQLLQIGLQLLAGSFSNANLNLTLGGLAPDFQQTLKFVPGSVRVTGVNPNAVKLKISPKTGTFAGSFVHNVLQKPTKFSGIFITSPFQIREGRGSFRGVGEGGRVRIAKP